MKHIFIRSILSLCFLAMGNPLFAADTRTGPLVKIETAIYFLTTDGSDVLVPPGTYQLEAAEEWLRLVPGERRDALLLEAYPTQHEEILRTPKATLKEEGDEHRLILLLPEGNGLKAIGSISGIRSRAVKRRLSSRSRMPQRQVSRIPTQAKNNMGNQKSKSIAKSPTHAKDPFAQRVQTLEHHIDTLQATITALQNRLAKIESAVQMDNAGNITISLAGKSPLSGVTFCSERRWERGNARPVSPSSSCRARTGHRAWVSTAVASAGRRGRPGR